MILHWTCKAKTYNLVLVSLQKEKQPANKQ